MSAQFFPKTFWVTINKDSCKIPWDLKNYLWLTPNTYTKSDRAKLAQELALR